MMDLFNILKGVKCTKETFACVNTIGTEGIPGDIVNIIHYVYVGIQVVIPILLIIFGMIELGKAITSQKEDEIKKAQGSFFKKLIVAVLIFLVTSIVRFVFYFANGSNKESKGIFGCVNQIISGQCSDAQEFDNYGSETNSNGNRS